MSLATQLPALSIREGRPPRIVRWRRGLSGLSYAPTIRTERRAADPARPVSSDADQLHLGPYWLVKRIGTGAMGDVYRAVHVKLDRWVAIKVLHLQLAHDPIHVARFVDEARVVNMLSHPNIIDVIDVVSDPGEPVWMVMQLLEGTDLKSLLDLGPLELGRTLGIARQLCDALTAVHGAGMVHRDIKPENLFISEHDGLDHVTLLDFGVACLRGRRGVSLAPSDGLVGTPQYMAPEQVLQGRLDHRADLYALGVVLFEAITGVPPFHDPCLRTLLGAITHAVPGVPSDLVDLPTAVRADLDHLVGSCLEKDPDHRPRCAAEIGVLIDAIATHLTVSRARSLALARPTAHGMNAVPKVVSEC